MLWHLQGRAEVIKDLQAVGAMTDADKEPPLQWEAAVWRLWAQLRRANNNGGYSHSSACEIIRAKGWAFDRSLRLLDTLQHTAMSFKKPK